MSLTTPLPPLRPVETHAVEDKGQEYILLRDPAGFSESMIAVAREALAVLALFDGRQNASEVAAQIAEAIGMEDAVPAEQILAMAEMLDEHHLLQSQSFKEHRKTIEQQFEQASLRPAALAGTGYPAEAEPLRKLLRQMQEQEPNEDLEATPPLPGKALTGLLAPHIDFQRGGPAYGRLYREAKRHLPTESGPILVGLIGVAHAGVREPLVAADKDFATPLGKVSVDRKAISILREELGEAPFREQWVHRSEHSIELQLVWLQELLEDREFSLLPLLAGNIDTGSQDSPHELASVEPLLRALKRIEKQHPGPVLWVASVDLAHVGPHFGDSKAVDELKRSAIAREDMALLGTLADADPESWWRLLAQDDNQRRVCGMNATYLALRLLEGQRGSLLDYQQAVAEDASQLVSYCSALFQRNED